MLRGDEESRPGWYGEVTGHINSAIALVGEVGGMYESIGGSTQSGPISVTFSGKVRMHTFLGGLRVTPVPSRVLVPYAQVLFGAGRMSATATTSISGFPEPFGFPFDSTTPLTTSVSQTQPVVQAGGGVTLNLNRSLGVRLTADRRWVFLEGGTGVTTRIGAGAVLRF
jgi:hypothetical protein